MTVIQMTELARQCKAMLSQKLGYPSKATLKDLKVLIKCNTSGDFNEAFTTKLYTVHRNEYGLALSIVKELSNLSLVNSSLGIANIKMNRRKFGKSNNGNIEILTNQYQLVTLDNIRELVARAKGKFSHTKLKLTTREVRIFGTQLVQLAIRDTEKTQVVYTFDYSQAKIL